MGYLLYCRGGANGGEKSSKLVHIPIGIYLSSYPVDCSTFLPRYELLQNLFCILQTLCYLGVASHKLVRQVVCIAPSLFVNIGKVTLVRRQQHFRVIIEHNLHSVVTQSEENGMFCAYPLLQVNQRMPCCPSFRRCATQQLLILFLLLFDKIIAEMLQQCHFLLEVVWVLC